MFKRLPVLFEGGHAFKDKATGAELTGRIQRSDVISTVEYLEGLTGLKLVDKMLGTTGKSATSGDLDLAVDVNELSKDDLVQRLVAAGFKPKEDIIKSGNNVHFKAAINGDPKNGFVQADFMFGEPEWMKFYLQGGGLNSPFKGNDRHILWSSIAKAQGLKISDKGLVSRSDNTIITTDPTEVAISLLGAGKTKEDMATVESVLAAIADRPDFDSLVAQALEPNSGIINPSDFAMAVEQTKAGKGSELLKEGLEVRIQHPEDMIYWEGSAGAQKAINALLDLAENAPATTTVKWDGSPAIIFGIDINGKFVLTDKGGFTVKSYKGRSESPEELEQMFLSRQNKPGKTLTPEYASFAAGMRGIFEPFRKALQDVEPGTFFKGDLLYMKQPKVVDGDYQFKPNVVTYRVSVDSELGNKIGQSTVGVVLHGIMREDSAGVVREESLDDLTQYFQGDLSSGGLLADSLLIFSPVFVNKPPKFGLDMVKDAEKVQATVESSAREIDAVLNEAALTAKKIKDLSDVLYTYTNSKADNFDSVSLNDFKEWVSNNQKLSKQKIGNLLQYISEQSSGFTALFEVVKAIESLKNKLVKQFDEQDMAVKAFIGDAPGGEGYVTKGKDSLLKLVHRGGFTAANRAVIRESDKGIKKIGFYPGSFKPFHRGHYESILIAKQQVDRLFVIASTGDRVREGEFPLSGQASQEYLETYIKPVLQEQGIDVVVSSISPVKIALDTAKADYDNNPNVEVFFFAGLEDIGRFNTKTLEQVLPNLSAEGRVHATPTNTVIGSGKSRISGTAMRKALDAVDLAAFKSMLPSVPLIQKNAVKIMELFIKDSPNALRREQEKNKERREKEKAQRQAAAVARKALREMLYLHIQEFLLEAKKKKKKVGFHVPKKYEPMVQMLKKKFGDPTEMEAGPAKKKAGALVFGTVQNIIKNKKK